jgi:hypothetical protein
VNRSAARLQGTVGNLQIAERYAADMIARAGIVVDLKQVATICLLQ